jgi:hypothetical protein
MKAYLIRQQSNDGQGCKSMIIRNRGTGEDIAEYRLTQGKERSEMDAMRDSIDQHLDQPGATLGNYQW